jgi:acetylornithine deacetylase/succinyl-diaminopimelate desuccinylase-like protein
MSSLLPSLPGLQPLTSSPLSSPAANYDLILQSTWLPQLTITAIEGLPATLADASNSIKKAVTLRCSLRLPPTLNAEKAEEMVRGIIEGGENPYGAVVEIVGCHGGNGFDTQELNPKVKKAFEDANAEVFAGNKPLYIGCGGSIPFMEFFSSMYPAANFLLTGVGFPDSNAHAANENLDLEFCRKLISTVALTLSKL